MECTRKHGLKINPNKFAFEVSTGLFLNIMVHERGIEVRQKSIKAINEIVPPTNKTKLQSLIGMINFIRKFISILSKKIIPFAPLLKLRGDQDFKRGDKQQKAFDGITDYLKMLPILMPLEPGKPFKLYLSTEEQSIRSALVQEVGGGGRKSHIVFKQKIVRYRDSIFLSGKFMPLFIFFFHKVEALLTIYRMYGSMQGHVVKHMLTLPILNGRIRKLILVLTEYDLNYESAKMIKGQVMVDFVPHHCRKDIQAVEMMPWVLFFDVSICKQGSGIAILIISP